MALSANAISCPRLSLCSRVLAVPRGTARIVNRTVRACANGEEPQWKLDLKDLNVAIKTSQPEREAAAPVQLTLRGDEERVYLVGVEIRERNKAKGTFTVDESLEELARLADTAGLQVVGSTYQSLQKPTPRTYVGSGKLAEIVAAVRATEAETVIFDDELSPGQQRNIEKALGEGIRVADRTALILDIFDQRAGSKEGRLQVDMAAAEYQLPRLRRMWTHLERQSGAGAGNVKGMGETQKEIDRRLLRDRMAALRTELQAVREHRKAYRKRRQAAELPVIALVGYTNAGKSTLINRLTASDVLAEDKLFATLDPTTRKMSLPMGKQVLISDTVGFIQKLPTQLIAAFRATLEEIEEADVLVHVVDVSHPDAAKQSDAVLAVLEDIGVSDDIPMVQVWNKVDLCNDPDLIDLLAQPRANTIAVSGRTGQNVDDLVILVEAALEEAMVPFRAIIPYSKAKLVNTIREAGIVRHEDYLEDGIAISASANLSAISRFEEYIVEYPPRARIFTWRQEQVARETLAGDAEDAARNGATFVEEEEDDLESSEGDLDLETLEGDLARS